MHTEYITKNDKRRLEAGSGGTIVFFQQRYKEDLVPIHYTFKEPEFYLPPEQLRDALCYVGIAAPESNEVLLQNAESYTKRIIAKISKMFRDEL